MTKEWKIVAALMALSSMFFAYFILVSDGFHGGGDSIAHFRLAKFSWEHPKYLLDHWGKPLFTLLTMPFARLGFKAMELYNLACGLASCLIGFSIAKHFKWKASCVIFSVVLFAPIFMQEFFSGLTEVTFTLLFLIAIWLNLKSHRILSLIVLSFLPFVRTEAVILIAWLGLIDIIEKKDLKTLFLLTGTLVYSLIGWMAKDDPLWLINELPYVGGEHIYGSGSIWHYTEMMPAKIGWPLISMAVFGCITSIAGVLTRERDAGWLWKFIIIPSLIYIGFHSFMWYVGRVSLGLPRMLAVVVPLFGLIGLYGVDRIVRLWESTSAQWAFPAVISVLAVWNGVSAVELPVKLGQEERVLAEVAKYIKEENLTDHKIHYYALYNEITLGVDPHNSEQCQQVIHNRANPHEEVEPGSLVIWDAHFSPNEGAMPLENLSKNEHFELLKIFEPEESFNTLGNRPYEVYLFIRKH